MEDPQREVTGLLRRYCDGDRSVSEELFPLVYDRLRSISEAVMRNERGDHTLEPTALVHEAFLRLVDFDGFEPDESDDARQHFLSLAVRAMRRILVEHARRRGSQRRGGGWDRVTLDEAAHLFDASPRGYLDLEWALERLGHIDPRLLRAAELRLFAGLSVRELAPHMRLSLSRAKVVWASARAMLAKLLDEGPGEGHVERDDPSLLD